jgi:hypothetical protein
VNPAFATVTAAAPIFGVQAVQGDVLCGNLLVAKSSNGVSIMEITPVGAVEFYSKDLPYVCLGSGKQNSDPFLAYMWSVYFSNSLPTLSEGVLMAYWTIQTAMKLGTAHVGLGIDVFTLDPANSPRIRELEEKELNGHQDFINEAANALRSVRDTMSGKAAPLPTVPKLETE